MCLGCSKQYKSSKRHGCKDKRNELIDLKLRVYECIQITKDPNLTLIETQLKEWIEEVQLKCPPEEEITLIKEIITQYEHSIN